MRISESQCEKNTELLQQENYQLNNKLEIKMESMKRTADAVQKERAQRFTNATIECIEISRFFKLN